MCIVLHALSPSGGVHIALVCYVLTVKYQHFTLT